MTASATKESIYFNIKEGLYMSDIDDSEWQRERMQRIRMLEQDLPYYRGQYNEAENKINEYFKDFEMFLDAIDSLSNVKTNINCGVDNLQNGLIVVNRYSEGNQHDNAMGVINDVKRLFEGFDIRDTSAFETEPGM